MLFKGIQYKYFFSRRIATKFVNKKEVNKLRLGANWETCLSW